MAAHCPTIAPVRGSSGVYKRITELMITELEKGVVPWRKPWTTSGSLPKNLISGKEYRGINRLLLWLAPSFDSPYFLTFLQAKELGGHVKKGAKGFPVIKYGRYEREVENETGEAETKTGQYLKGYAVFNADQCELPAGVVPVLPMPQTFDFAPIERAQQIADVMPQAPVIRRGGNVACYTPSSDTVDMPQKNRFELAGGYYSTLFHELTHSTGHDSRLNRKGITDQAVNFASKTYLNEELIAELGASFLCASAGIENIIEQSASYIDNWLKRLKDDRALIVKAASQAQQASDFILNAGGHEQ